MVGGSERSGSRAPRNVPQGLGTAPPPGPLRAPAPPRPLARGAWIDRADPDQRQVYHESSLVKVDGYPAFPDGSQPGTFQSQLIFTSGTLAPATFDVVLDRV